MSNAADKVVSLTGGPVPDTGAPNEPTIDVLREMLERAESGEVVGVALAVLHSDRTASWRVGGMVGSFSLIGALRRAEHDLLTLDE